jgi:hypothetical protein
LKRFIIASLIVVGCASAPTDYITKTPCEEGYSYCLDGSSATECHNGKMHDVTCNSGTHCLNELVADTNNVNHWLARCEPFPPLNCVQGSGHCTGPHNFTECYNNQMWNTACATDTHCVDVVSQYGGQFNYAQCCSVTMPDACGGTPK